MAVKVEGIELEIRSNAKGLSGELDNLTKSLERVKAAAKVINPSKTISGGSGGGGSKGGGNAFNVRSVAPGKGRSDLLAGLTGGGKGAPKIQAVTRAVKELNKAAHSASMGGLSKLGAAFKRILFYRMIRTVIKEIANAFKEGANNAYQYSKAIAGPLAMNMDKLATSILFMKNGLGAAVAPIINALTPIIERLADAIANLGNTIAGLIAKLTGQSTYIKAIKNMTAYADATNAAAKAQRQLLGFDELNVLTDSGSGSGSSVDYSKMFETVETGAFSLGDTISNALKAAVEKLEGIDWKGLPGKIKDKIKEAIETYPFAENFKALGELIGTALISVIHFGEGILEALFGDAINKALGDLGDNPKWYVKGPAIATAVLGAILKGFGDVGAWAWENIGNPLITGIINGLFGTEFTELTDIFKPLASYFNQAIYEIEVAWSKLIVWINENTPFNFKVPQVDTSLLGGTTKGKVGQLGTSISNLKNTALYYKNKATSTPVLAPAQAVTNPIGAAWQIISGIASNLFADGGYPVQGSMFIAGEAGPELVSNINGRTGVINNDQFSAIVATAADNVINAILASGQSVAAAAREGGNVYMDRVLVSRQLYPTMEREGQRVGPSAVTVG